MHGPSLWCTSNLHLVGEKGRVGPSLLHTTLRDQRSMWVQDGCKVYMDSYMASSGSCFMATWTIFKNHLLDIGLTQNQETTTPRTLTTIDLFYFIMCEDPHEHKYHWNSIWLRARSHMASHYTWGTMTTLLHDFEGVRYWRPLDTFVWALTNSWSRLLVHVWRGPKLSQAAKASLKSGFFLSFLFSFFNAELNLQLLLCGQSFCSRHCLSCLGFCDALCQYSLSSGAPRLSGREGTQQL